MVHAGCVFVDGFHPSRAWMSGSFESLRWNACVHRLDLGLYSHPKEYPPLFCCKMNEKIVNEIRCRKLKPWNWLKDRVDRSDDEADGATRGVTVSMSAFLAYHQCYCAGSSLAWGLNLRAVVCGIFWSSSPGVFSGYSEFLPSSIGLMVQPIK